MKGLIFKELYISRKEKIIGILVWLEFLFVSCILLASARFGNLQKLYPDNAEAIRSDAPILIYALGAVIMISLSTLGKTIASDYNCRFGNYIHSLPVSAEKITASRFIVIFCSVVVGFFLSLLSGAIVCIAADMGFKLRLIKNLTVCAGIVIIICCALVPIYEKYKTTNAVTARITLFLCSVYAAVASVIIKKSFDFSAAHPEAEDSVSPILGALFNDIKRYINKFGFLLPIIMIPLLVLSYCMSVRILKRREN